MDVLPAFDKNAAYIWACYAVAFAGIVGACVSAWLIARKAQRTLKQYEHSAESEGRSGP